MRKQPVYLISTLNSHRTVKGALYFYLWIWKEMECNEDDVKVREMKWRTWNNGFTINSANILDLTSNHFCVLFEPLYRVLSSVVIDVRLLRINLLTKISHFLSLHVLYVYILSKVYFWSYTHSMNLV